MYIRRSHSMWACMLSHTHAGRMATTYDTLSCVCVRLCVCERVRVCVVTTFDAMPYVRVCVCVCVCVCLQPEPEHTLAKAEDAAADIKSDLKTRDAKNTGTCDTHTHTHTHTQTHAHTLSSQR